MVFFIEHPKFDYMTKRKILALVIVFMSAAWTPIARELFLNFMNTEIVGTLTIGLVVSLTGLIGAWGLYSKRWF